MKWLQCLMTLPTIAVIGVVRAYQITLSPLIGPCCRYTPSCSEYMVLAIRKYGLLSGVVRGLLRIVRCHPWKPGGYDPP